MTRSLGLRTCARLGIRLSSEQQALILEAESGGLIFGIHFGYSTPRETIRREALLLDIKKMEAKKAAS